MQMMATIRTMNKSIVSGLMRSKEISRSEITDNINAAALEKINRL